MLVCSYKCTIKNETCKYFFLTGEFFKGKNPNVVLDELKKNWIDDTLVVYIGKAGGGNSKATLKSRLRQYFGFGQGKSIGHWGGRLI